MMMVKLKLVLGTTKRFKPLLPDLRQSLLLKVLMSREPRKLFKLIVKMRTSMKKNASN
jgi:hypothetical protein